MADMRGGFFVRTGEGTNMFRRPLAAFAACWITGGASAATFTREGVLLAGLALTAALAAIALARGIGPRTAAACVLAYAFAAGHRAWIDARNVTELADLAAMAEAGEPPAAVEAVLTIETVPRIDGDRVMFRARLEEAAYGGGEPRKLRNERVQVRVRLGREAELETAAKWRRGDRAALSGVLERPNEAVNFGGFDYRAYLYRHRIHWLLEAESAESFKPLGRGGGAAMALQRGMDRLRGALAGRMAELFPEDQSGYMNGLVLGERDGLDPELYDEFAELGLTHILAISGLHVGVFLLGVGSLLRLFRLPRETTLELTAAAVPFYVLLTGASPSVVRAGLMAMIGLVAARMNRLKDGVNLLAAAALAMLAYDPYYLSDIAFQLSFAVTAGLIALVPPVRRALPLLKRGRALADLLVVTAVAQAVSFPLTIFYFNRFHLLSLPANAVLVPFISFVVMPFGTAALLVSFVWPDAGRLLARVTEAANDATFTLVEKLAARLELATIWPTPPLWWILAWYGALLLVARLLPDRSAEDGDGAPEEETRPLAGWPDLPDHRPSTGRTPTRARLILPLAAALLLAYAWAPDRFDRTATVAFLDVGQGDAALIRTPSGRHILVDGGGTLRFEKPGDEWRRRLDPFDVGEDVVVPLLMKRGVRKLDLVVATHLDADHIGGLAAVLDKIPAKALLWNGTLNGKEDGEALLRLADERGVRLIAARAGLEPFRPDDATELAVLWPAADSATSDGRLPALKDQNGRSVVLNLTVGGYDFLFTGDIGFPEERAILDRLPDEPAAVDVMKIAHHGSRHSTADDWLAYWRPLEAVISAGRNNVYGHPHPDTLGRIAAAGARVRRTDANGETQYRIEEGALSVRTALPNSA
jgi:competence protein ComEC